MFYFLMRFLFRISLRLYYKRIFVSGLENLPKNKPVIFASNHPNAFMDAFLVGAFSNKTMFTLVRSDAFMNPFITWFLGLFKLLPVYRSQEGAKNLKKNEISFQKCIVELKKGRNILIFSEGTSIMGKHLLRLKKGTARLALKAHEKMGEEMMVIPVGLNYTHFTQSRKEVMVNFGTPISTEDYIHQNIENPNYAINKLTQDMYLGLKKEVITLDYHELEHTFEDIIAWKRNEFNYPLFISLIFSKSRFITEKEIANKLNKQFENKEQYPLFIHDVHEYKKLLSKNNVKDSIKKSVISTPLLILLSVVLSPFFIIGSVVHFICFPISKWLAVKTLKDKEFHTSVELSLGMIIYLIICIFIFLNLNILYSIEFLFITYTSLVIRYFIHELWQDHMQYISISKITSQHKELHTSREIVFKHLN